MSGNSQFVADSLSELLASIADGIRDAQTSLSQLPGFDAYGRPLPSYHLPYLDFTLNVDVESETSESGMRRIKMLPIARSNNNQRIHSSISGRFVAVPPGEGLPLPVIALNLTPDPNHARTYILEVMLSNTAGEIISDANVEINIDSVATELLNPNQTNIHTLARLERALITTNNLGRAYTRVQLQTAFPEQANLVLSADFKQQDAHISLNPGALA